METIVADVLVVGAGSAAARAAVEAAGSGVSVHLVDKGEFGKSGTSTPCLLGLATTFSPEDSPERFFEDWLRSSSYVSEDNLVWEAITRNREAVESLEAVGMEFIRDADGARLLYRGAGHTVARGLTVKSHSALGPNVVTVLRAEAERRGVGIHENIMITRLLRKGSRVVGAVGISPKGVLTVFKAKAVVLAAGSANRLYPNVAHEIADERYRTTGDSYCLAFAAGASLIDLEFTQFREAPPGAARFGGRYLNALGERFMEKYEPQALEKAPRHKVVEAVYREIMAKRGPVVWVVEGIRELEMDMEIAKEYSGRGQIEMTIELQRLLGGARINEKAETEVPGLFAAGESAGGVHGGGRMQGNAFLETQVFGMNAGKNASAFAKDNEAKAIDPAELSDEQSRLARIGGNVDPADVVKAVKQTMWECVGIVRDSKGLQKAVTELEQLREEKASRLYGENIIAALEAQNLLTAGDMVARAALAREETRGAHIRSDYPDTDDKWRKHVCLSNQNGEIAISTVPIAPRLKQ